MKVNSIRERVEGDLKIRRRNGVAVSFERIISRKTIIYRIGMVPKDVRRRAEMRSEDDSAKTHER